ncbi:MAG: extracellular solute-binding protein [Ectothiorhodospiraceae bacterium AqS1]|nr:extracellular solute-binding protein [Ectothiorhodospiraceae bacterium AqS1]
MKSATKWLAAIAASGLVFTGQAAADQIRFLCYQEGNECDVIADIAKGYEAKSGHSVITERVGYEVIRDQLENQLQTDAAPDLARVTNLGGLNKYYLDLRPYFDTAELEKQYSATLPWFQAPGGEDTGVYGWMTELTVTGPYVNVSMFDDAGVELPGEGATWDDWATALMEVKEALGIDAGLAMDRTTHRWAGPAFSHGAKFFDDKGHPILVDQGFREFAEKFVAWHENGLMPAEGWPAGQGTQYRNAAPLFLSGKVAMHMSGSWMIGNYSENIKDFEWRVVSAPCGTGGCGAMPGGSAIVALKSTQYPQAAAGFIEYMSRAENAEVYAARTKSITSHQGLQDAGVDYQDASPAVAAALSTYASSIGKAAQTTPQAFTFQGYHKNFVIYGVVPDYLTQVINGEIALDEALSAIDADVAAKIAE